MTTPVTPPAAGPAARGTARERLLAAADVLFYEEGVQTVGIDRIIERAGVAKASLYNTYGSKDGLVRAYLEARHARTARRLATAIEGYESPRDRLLAVFEAQGELFGDPHFRGCAFASASAEAGPESAAYQVTAAYRAWLRGLLTELAEKAGARDPGVLARRLQLLYDGVGVSARIDHDPAAAEAARAAAGQMLDAAS